MKFKVHKKSSKIERSLLITTCPVPPSRDLYPFTCSIRTTDELQLLYHLSFTLSLRCLVMDSVSHRVTLVRKVQYFKVHFTVWSSGWMKGGAGVLGEGPLEHDGGFGLRVYLGSWKVSTAKSPPQTPLMRPWVGPKVS